MEYNPRLLKSAEQTAWSGLVARLNELQICSEFGAAGVGEKGSQDAGSQRFPSSFTYIFIFRYTSFWATCQQSNIFIALKRFANNFCFGSCWRNRKMGRLGAEARAAGNHVVDICSNDLQLLIFIWPKKQLLKKRSRNFNLIKGWTTGMSMSNASTGRSLCPIRRTPIQACLKSN